MSEKIVTDALHSPSLVGELKDYHKNLVNTVAKRGLLVLLSALFLLLQYVGVIFPAHSANSTSTESDAIYGGVDSKQEMLIRYDSKDSTFRSSSDALSITRDELAKTSETSLRNWLASNQSLVVAWSRSPVYRLDSEPLQSNTRSSFLALANQNSFKYYGHSVDGQSLGQSNKKVLAGYSSRSGHFAILKDSGNLITTSSEADTCYKKPDDPVSYVNCTNSNTFKSRTTVTNISYNNDARYIKNRVGDRLQYDIALKNSSSKPIHLTPEIYIGDILEYAELTNVDQARFDGQLDMIEWPQTTIEPGQEKTFSFIAQLLNPVPINPKGSTNATSYDCYMSSFFGGITNVKVYCPTPKTMERMLSAPPVNSLIALSWIILIVNILLYIKINIVSKEHGHILRAVRRKHD